MVDKNNELKKLAEKAAQDPEKFKELIAQLNKVLEQAEKAVLLELLLRN